MARYAGWESIPMAEGGEGPVWPLPTVKPTFTTWRHTTPRAPLVIINPGTYTIVAERSAVGLRGIRRRT